MLPIKRQATTAVLAVTMVVLLVVVQDAALAAATPTYVNDNWDTDTDNGAAGLTVGDIVKNNNDTVNPGTVTATYGVDGFGTVTTGTSAGSLAGSDKISDAVSATTAGGTLNILDGTYAESGITISSAMTIAGVGTSDTIIDPSAGVIVFRPKADGITFRDLTIQNASQGVRFEDAGNTIDNTEFDNVHFVGHSSRGIEIHNATTVTDLRVLDSLFDDSNIGIRWASSGVGDGILIDGSTFQDQVLGVYQANDRGTGFVENLHIEDSTFTNHSDTAIFAEEIRDSVVESSTFRDNRRSMTIFKAYTTVGLDVENIVVKDNEFFDGVDAALIMFIFTGSAADITIQDNMFERDVGNMLANWAVIDVRLKQGLAPGTVEILDNEIDLSGTFAQGGATATFGVKLRGDLDDVTVRGNDLDGGSVGTVSGAPPTSGVYIQTTDGTFGSVPASAAVDISKNIISSFDNGVSVFDSSSPGFGGLPSGNDVHINRNDLAGVSDFGIQNGSATVDGTCNWWGGGSGGPSGVGTGTGSKVSSDVTFAPWLVSSDLDDPCIGGLLPMQLKDDAIEELEALKPELNDEGEKRLDAAVEYLTESLFGEPGDGEMPWLDESHLSPDNGDDVFGTENDTVEKLMEILEKPGEFGASASVVAEIEFVIEHKILEADRLLAQTAIDEAAGGDADLLAEAAEEMANAETATANGEYDKAVENYFKAWEAALKSVGIL